MTTGHWLFDQADAAKETRNSPAAAAQRPYSGETSRYAAAALTRECDTLKAAPEGTRNHTLNVAALKLGGLIAAGEIDEQTVTDALTHASHTAGLNPRETKLTIRSGLTKGKTEPRPPRPGNTYTPPPVTILGDIPAAADPLDHIDEIKQRLPILNWHDLWNDTTTEEWIVEPLIPARRSIALFSAPKLGKSLLMLELAVQIAEGTRALGADLDRPRRVLYIDFENDPRGDIRERLQAMNYQPDNLANLCYLSYPSLAHLDTEKGALELLAAAKAYECEVVIIDTISRAVGGDENENDTWLNFYRQTGMKAKQAGLTLLRLDHTGKDETKGMRGGSAKYGDVDVVWKMSRLTETTFRLECTDNRLPINEKTLVVERRENPLRHHVEPRGISAAWRIKMDAFIRIMDDALLPKDAGRAAALEAIRAAGLPVDTNVLREAIKRRRLMGDVSVIDLTGNGLSQAPPEHLTETPPVSEQSGEPQ